ncbi:MAG: type II toxin-antitoxin system VapC family toxin [Nitrospirota bacterium]
MIYLLDTNICIYIIKKKPIEVLSHFTNMNMGTIGISSITLSELEYGAYKSQQRENNLLALEMFITPLNILLYNANAARIYGKIRSNLEAKGKPIGSMDMLIAAHAISENCILVTNNEKEFSYITELKIENWVTKTL